MQNKKSQAGIIVLIIFLIILILIGVSVAIYGTKSKWFSKREEKKQQKIPAISIFARVSYPNGNLAKANYFLDADKVTLKQGLLSGNAWTAFSEMPINKSYRLCYWTDEFYRQCTIYLRSVSFVPLNKNMTIFKNITMNEELQSRFRKGAINIATMDKMQKGTEQILRLNISAKNGSLSRINICTWHSIGIIRLIKPEIAISCDERWLNYTFDIEGNQVNLTNNMYWCKPENKIEQCTQVTNRRECIVPNISPPSRLKNKVDFCYYTGESIFNDNYIAEYRLETMPFINQLDYINFYIVDMELIKDGSEYPVRTEDTFGNDVGIKDILYQLNYTNG